ncbi:hypothetical protein Ahy_B04g073134 [Arachis hypogaea]|uniref:Uncharacterized protein n=1 Tax=Arachis hypogaea TaxID=3818 RepID=A0A444ZPN5_ARAHY|nr:hypothetical protein Ahy_B04g073134 [Arachis hypogaea]
MLQPHKPPSPPFDVTHTLHNKPTHAKINEGGEEKSIIHFLPPRPARSTVAELSNPEERFAAVLSRKESSRRDGELVNEGLLPRVAAVRALLSPFCLPSSSNRHCSWSLPPSPFKPLLSPSHVIKGVAAAVMAIFLAAVTLFNSQLLALAAGTIQDLCYYGSLRYKTSIGDVYKYYVDGHWKKSSSGKFVPIINPTTRNTHYKVQGLGVNFKFGLGLTLGLGLELGLRFGISVRLHFERDRTRPEEVAGAVSLSCLASSLLQAEEKGEQKGGKMEEKEEGEGREEEGTAPTGGFAAVVVTIEHEGKREIRSGVREGQRLFHYEYCCWNCRKSLLSRLPLLFYSTLPWEEENQKEFKELEAKIATLAEAVSNMVSSRLSLCDQGTPIVECGVVIKEYSEGVSLELQGIEEWVEQGLPQGEEVKTIEPEEVVEAF